MKPIISRNLTPLPYEKMWVSKPLSMKGRGVERG
jgi:hypothetical protein